MADEECAAVPGALKEVPCATNKEEAGSSEAEYSAAAGRGDDGEDAPPANRVRMLMSHEDIDSILSHKARGDSFKEFHARVAREVEETGDFEVSEEHIKNVQEARAWIREEFSNVRSQYPHLVWEGDDEDDGADATDGPAAAKSN